jgi:nitrate/nitrite-specific signal transduction histidine kinase
MLKIKSIGWKLYFRIGLIMIIVFTGIALVLVINNKNYLQNEVTLQAKSFANFATNQIINNYQLYFSSGYLKFREQMIKTLELNPNITRIQIIDLNGNILVDSDAVKEANLWQEYHQKDNKISDVILQNLNQPKPYYVFDPKDKNRILEIYQPFVDEWGKYNFVVKYSISYQNVSRAIQALIKKIAIFSSIGFIVTILALSLNVKKIIVNPLVEFKQGINQIIKGNFNKKIILKTNDEIEELANTFNQMIEKIVQYQEEIKESKDILEIKVRARTRELQELAENLELEVQERTKDLKEKINELEKFHKLAIGRELKMIELKKKIKELESQLKNDNQKKNLKDG